MIYIKEKLFNLMDCKSSQVFNEVVSSEIFDLENKKTLSLERVKLSLLKQFRNYI
jgi:hypothetical protein